MFARILLVQYRYTHESFDDKHVDDEWKVISTVYPRTLFDTSVRIHAIKDEQRTMPSILMLVFDGDNRAGRLVDFSLCISHIR